MRPSSAWDYSILTVRVVLGLWCFGLGVEKAFLVGAPAFAKNVENFAIFVGGWNLVIAYLVPWLEIVVGLCLMGGWVRRGAARMALVMTLGFIFVSAQAWWFGLPEDCGCFGSWFEVNHPQKMGLLVVQLLVVVFVIATERGGVQRIFRGSRMRLP